ncbi:SDR family oxidoreductase [Mycolicibacterium vaccae]|nr:SDR family oxidoreductase [Mycolicibacterium vaccae]
MVEHPPSGHPRDDRTQQWLDRAGVVGTGLGRGDGGGAPYSVTKHGIIGLLRNAALELGPHGITVNAICPGFIDTDMHHWQDAYDAMSGQPNGTPDDLVQAARHYRNPAGQQGY